METTSLENYLKSFGRKVVDDAQRNLNSAKGDTALEQSIRFEVVPTDKGFSTRFYMLDYGTYLDKGVSGNEEEISYINTKGQTVSSPYSYTTKHPPTSILEVWIAKKGLEGTKGNKSFAFAIAKTIKKKGIKSLSFFQAPLGEEYKKLKEGMLTELKLDIESYLTTFYRN